MCDEMSQAEFAEMLGVSGSTISSIENGDQIVSLETAAAWAAAIGYHEPRGLCFLLRFGLGC